MDDANYQRLITAFCSEVGISDWQGVMRSEHVDVDGTVVGLIPDPAIDSDRLGVYIDLGPMPEGEEANTLQRRMLVANVVPRGDITGSFGQHPHNGNATYHMSFELPLRGDELARRVRDGLDEAASLFESMKNPQNEWEVA